MCRARSVSLVLTVALLAAACSQPPPEREAFEVPSEIVPDWVNTVDPDELFPTEGGCLLAVGDGVRVLEVLEGTAAYGMLRAGDILLSVDGTSVNSKEMLLRELADRPVGDVVTVDGTRIGEPFSIDIVLTPVPGEPGRAVLGIVPETKLAPVAPPSAPTGSGSADPFSRPVLLNGRIYLHEPLAAVWSPYPGVPADRMAALGSDLYAVAAADPLSLVKVGGGGDPIAIEPGPVMLEGVVGQVEVLVTGFEAALASVGDLVLVGGEVAAGVGDTGIFTLIAVDPNARSVVWIRALGLSQNDNPLVAVEGYRSPSGEQALITLVEHDPASDARSDVWSYYLIDEYGEGVVGPPGIDRFFPTSGVTGWYDEGSLLYVADLSVPQIVTWELDTGDHSPIRPVSAEDAPDLVTVTPVGDGQHVVQVRESEVSLIDVALPEPARPISRGCRYEPIGGIDPRQ